MCRPYSLVPEDACVLRLGHGDRDRSRRSIEGKRGQRSDRRDDVTRPGRVVQGAAERDSEDEREGEQHDDEQHAEDRSPGSAAACSCVREDHGA